MRVVSADERHWAFLHVIDAFSARGDRPRHGELANWQSLIKVKVGVFTHGPARYVSQVYRLRGRLRRP
jgi:hypothetical protein